MGGALAAAACTSTPSASVDAGPDGASANDGSTAPPITCDDLVHHQETCGRLGDAGDARDLLCAWLDKTRLKWRPDFFAAFYGCFINHPCSHDDDECLASALAIAPDSLVDHAALQRCVQGDDAACSSFLKGAAADCLSRRSVCLNEGTPGFSDDLCITIPALNADSLGGVPSCLAQPCDQVPACLMAIGSFTY